MTMITEYRGKLGWSVPELARRLNLSSQSVYAWDNGRNSRGNPSEAPSDVLVWLEKVSRAIDRIPPPERYRNPAPTAVVAEPDPDWPWDN